MSTSLVIFDQGRGTTKCGRGLPTAGYTFDSYLGAYEIRREDYYDDYYILLFWSGWVKQFGKKVNISCQERNGAPYRLTEEYVSSSMQLLARFSRCKEFFKQGNYLMLYPTTWPCDRTANLTISDGGGIYSGNLFRTERNSTEKF